MMDKDLFFLERVNSKRDNHPFIILALVGLIGVAGIVLGIIGIKGGHEAKKEIALLRHELHGGGGEKVGNYYDRNERLMKVSLDVAHIKMQMRHVVEQTQQAFDSVSKELKVNRDQIICNSNEMLIMADNRDDSRLEPIRSLPDIETITPLSIDALSNPKEPAVYHRIQGGDTINKLTRIYGKSQSDFLVANPGIDPQRLQIGQSIIIPD